MFDNHRNWQRIAGSTAVSFGLMLLAVVALFGAASAQIQPEPIVRPDPVAITATAGQTVTVEFVVEGVENLYGADVRAKFDPAVLEVVDANPSQDGVQIVPGSFLKPDFVVRQVADNAAGTIWYASTQVSPTLPVSGAGVLFAATLRAKAGVANSPITITSVELVDHSGRGLVTGPQAQQTVTATAAITAVEPAATTAPATPTTAPLPTEAVRMVDTVAPPGQGAGETAAPTSVPAPGSGALPPLCAPPGIVVLALGVVAAGGIGWWARRRSGR